MADSSVGSKDYRSKLPRISVKKLVVINKESRKELKSCEVKEKQRGGLTLLKKFAFFQKWTRSPNMRSARLLRRSQESDIPEGPGPRFSHFTFSQFFFFFNFCICLFDFFS